MFNFFKFNSQQFNSRDTQTNFEKVGDLEFTLLIESDVSYTAPKKKKKGGAKKFFQPFSLELKLVGKKIEKTEYDFIFIGTRLFNEINNFDIFGKIIELELQDLTFAGLKIEKSEESSLLKGNRIYGYLEETNIVGRKIFGKDEVSGIFKGTKILSFSETNRIIGKKLNKDHFNTGFRGYKIETINAELNFSGKQNNESLFEALALIEE